MVFHCLNRSVARLTLFEKEADYEALERVIEEAHDRVPLRLLDFTIIPNIGILWFGRRPTRK